MNTQLPRNAQVLLVAIACLGFCSCQTLQTPGRQEPQRVASAQVSPAQVAPVPATQFTPQPGRPVATPGYYAQPQHTVAMLPHGPQPSQRRCACCGPKERFAFSDGGHSCPPGADCGNGQCADGPYANEQCASGQCAYHPYDEYVCDGGDNEPSVRVTRDWAVYGLDQEDTVVHYDTIRGGTEWSASNKVCLYAPRFAAVRQVTSMELSEQADRLALADKALETVVERDLSIVTNVNQPQQPALDLGIHQAQSVFERQKGLTAETTRYLAGTRLELLPYENLERIRSGVMQNDEKPRLAQVAQNAEVWSNAEAVQVVLDGKMPLESKLAAQPGETVMYDLAGKPRMRIIKIADSSEAQVGDIVSFTLRFDNVGEQKVGNVTIIDNLTTRLEYVEGSQECSHEAKFHTTPNEGETLTLRWEIKEPMRVGEGGIIRFKCRVR